MWHMPHLILPNRLRSQLTGNTTIQILPPKSAKSKTKKHNSMEQKKNFKKRWLTVRLSDDEYNKVQQYCKDSTCPGLSDYVRRLVLNRPINIKYRNKSIDDFLADMMLLKKELNAIGVNYNQSVHVLHTLETIPEFRQWITRNEEDKAILFRKIELILARINQLYSIWSQS
jgi:hypothetical protein